MIREDKEILKTIKNVFIIFFLTVFVVIFMCSISYVIFEYLEFQENIIYIEEF